MSNFKTLLECMRVMRESPSEEIKIKYPTAKLHADALLGGDFPEFEEECVKTISGLLGVPENKIYIFGEFDDEEGRHDVGYGKSNTGYISPTDVIDILPVGERVSSTEVSDDESGIDAEISLYEYQGAKYVILEWDDDYPLYFSDRKAYSVLAKSIKEGDRSRADHSSEEDTEEGTSTDYIWDGKSDVPSDVVSVKIKNGVTSIRDYAFKDRTMLRSVKIPNSVKKIGTAAFMNCYELESVEIPNSVKKIDDSAFARCESFKSVVIPDSVTEIGFNAFGRCSSLRSVKISRNIVRLGRQAFYGCPLDESSRKEVEELGRKKGVKVI